MSSEGGLHASRHEQTPTPACESHIPQKYRKFGTLTSSMPRKLRSAPLVTITPPATPAMSSASISSSRSSTTSIREPPSSPPSHSSIPTPVAARSVLHYPKRRDQRHLPQHRELDASPNTETPPTKNFSRPQTSQSDRFSLSSRVSVCQDDSSSPMAPSATLAVMSRTERPRLVHNRGGSSLPSSPLESPSRSSMESDFTTSGAHAGFADAELTKPTMAELAESFNLPQQQQTLTSTDLARTSADSSRSSFRRKPLPKAMSTYASRFASPLPSIPSQMSLRFSNNITDLDNFSTDSEGENDKTMPRTRQQSRNGDVPRYTLSREQSPTNGHTRLTMSRRTHPHRTSDPTPSANAYYLSEQRSSPSKRSSESIGYPSNMTRPHEHDDSANSPEVRRYRSSPTLNKPLPRSPTPRGSSMTANSAHRDASSPVGASPSPAHRRSRSRQVIHKLSGIFSTKRSTPQLAPQPQPAKLEKRPRGRETPTPTPNPLPSGAASPRDGDRSAQIQRVKSLVAALRDEAAMEGERMNGETSRRELALRQTAQVLAETMIYSVEAEIAATKAAGEAERARRFCELAGKCAEKVLSGRE